MRFALLALVSTLLAPAPALADDAALVTRELPLRSARAPAAAQAPIRFNLIGLHWRGGGRVEFRTRSIAGRWSAWRPAAPEAEDGPDPRSAEAARSSSWRIGNPYWTGTSDRVDYRVRGDVRRVRAHFVWSPVNRVPPRTLSVAASPAIVPRLGWRANEGIRRDRPRFARAVRYALVHHTAGGNGYGRAESAAIVRAIQLYHVQGNGWDDIGYNFLVDRFGQVFEGRSGGVARNVVGAHAQGFNTGSVGVSVIGNYSGTSISAAASAALVRLLAWRLDLAHVDPASALTAISSGNPRFPAGVPVFLRSISAHRDTGFTSCPGDLLYRRLGSIAAGVATTGLPKLYSPAVRGSVGGRVRFTGRLSSPMPWTVTVTDGSGRKVAAGAGLSSSIGWTWDARAAPRRAHYYAIEAGPTVRPVRGRIGSSAIASPAPALPTTLISTVKLDPATVTPNGDGVQDTTTVSYALGAAALVTATLVDASGVTVAMLFGERQQAGARSFRFTADTIPDGRYQIVVNAVADDGRQLSMAAALIVSRVLRAFAAKPALFSPNADGRLDRVRFTFQLLSPATVTLRIQRDGIAVATPVAGELRSGAQQIVWDGSSALGRVPDGRYRATLTVADAVATLSQGAAIVVDTTPPRAVPAGPWRLRVSEPAVATVVAGGKRLALRIARAGIFVVPRLARVVQVSLRDAAGNAAAPVRVS